MECRGNFNRVSSRDRFSSRDTSKGVCSSRFSSRDTLKGVYSSRDIIRVKYNSSSRYSSRDTARLSGRASSRIRESRDRASGISRRAGGGVRLTTLPGLNNTAGTRKHASKGHRHVISNISNRIFSK